MGRIGRGLWIATPFLLLAAGFYALVSSPWPSIWRLMLKGEHVRVACTWSTVGLAALAFACIASAVGVSLTIRRRR